MITDIRLQQFRSYSDATFELSPAVNIIVGPNASGKTNLLEAILLTARGSSYRAKDNELIQFGKEWTRLDAHTPRAQRTVKIKAPSAEKTFEISGKTFRRLSLQHTIPAVLFEPDHLHQMTGSPDMRRGYIDEVLEQTTPGYGSLRRQYRRTLAQRNALLKKSHPSVAGDQFFPWDIRLSELGGKIVRARTEFAKQINQQLSDLYQQLSGSAERVTLEYQATFSPASYETGFLKKLQSSQELDVLRGFTGTGPHREDIAIHINGRPLQDTASRGEKRTIVLALKIMELQFIERARGTKPLLLLDDVFSELDGARLKALTNFLRDYQTFITTTDADAVIDHFTDCTMIPLSKSQA